MSVPSQILHRRPWLVPESAWDELPPAETLAATWIRTKYAMSHPGEPENSIFISFHFCASGGMR